jgi:two-component system phosphate regulon sensor histidine kinase PhoR
MVRGRARLASFILLPAVLVAVGVLAYFTIRTTLQVERLRQQAVLEATLALANEKADRLDKGIIEQDNVAFAIADPGRISELAQRWLPTAKRETPTVRALLVLDEAHTVRAFASRTGGAFGDEEAFRRLLVQRMCSDMDLPNLVPDELHHLHRTYRGQSYLVSYWVRTATMSADLSPNAPAATRRFLIVAWHDVGRIVKDTMPSLFAEAASPSRVNVVDEDGRIVYGPPLRTGQFTVAVRFPTTLYGWRVQVSPSGSDELSARFQNRALLEFVMMMFACIVVVLGVVTILLAAERESRISTLKSEFVANVSHELKTPLALIRMFGEMLQSGRVASDDKRQQYLDIIVAESERLSALIENVLDFARVERGRHAYDFGRADVGEAVARAVSVYRHQAEREGVEVTVEFGGDLLHPRVDARAIQLAVINLIDNALKYASGSKVVQVRAKRMPSYISIRVTDNGPGVAEEDRERIFERFVRGTAARTRSVRGSGIGLALVKHIAESHGGRAWVEGAPGGGATFVILLPMTRPGRSANARSVGATNSSAQSDQREVQAGERLGAEVLPPRA